MHKKFITVVLLLLLSSAGAAFTGCDEHDPSTGTEELTGLEQAAEEEGASASILEQVEALYESLKMTIQDALFSTPRVIHDRNLSTIDRAVELFQLAEGKDPTGIGESGESGTLVGEEYLDGVPQIPAGLQQEEGEWSAYTLKGDPLRTWPVGDWGGYRDGDIP